MHRAAIHIVRLIVVCLLTIAHAPAIARGSTVQNRSSDEVDQRVTALMDKMTLEEKVGQLFLVFFNGQDVSPSLLRSIKDYHVGGIVLFQPNIVSAKQTAALNNAAQRESIANGAKIPLFISVDQEGGLITRLPAPAPTFPSQMALGATGDLKLATRMAEAHAEQLHALGFNMNFAPVLDVNDNANNPIIGTRSFSGRSDTVSQFGLAMIRAYRAKNIIAVPKHFPGHGSAVIDSHDGLPVIQKTLAQVEATELAPFKQAIDAGNTDAMMTAHVVLPALDNSGLPATLSSKVLQGVLREKLGFRGLIVSDSMTMDAIDSKFSVDKALVMAFRAGVDVLALGADVGTIPIANRRDYQAFLRAVKAEPALQARLEESVRRILTTKARYGVLDWKPVDEAAAEDILASESQLAAARDVARGSITLVRDTAGQLPLQPTDRVLLIAPKERDRVGFYTSDALIGPLKACAPNVTVQLVNVQPNAAEIRRATDAAANADKVVVATLNARFYADQARLVRALKQPIVLALRNPYDALVMADSVTFLTGYSDVPVTLEALVNVICGKAEPLGRMPVELVLPTPTPTLRIVATRAPKPAATPAVTATVEISGAIDPAGTPVATPTPAPVARAPSRPVARKPVVVRKPIVVRKPVATRRPVARVPSGGGQPPLPPPPP